MKILVICQYYYPEPFRIPDICEELVARSHDVTVVTGTPNYPMGEIYDGYENGKKSDELLNGVKVHRCITAPRKTGAVNRLKNYFSYAIESKKYIKTLSDDFDVVFVNQLSPVMMAVAGIEYKKKFGKKLVLYCLDLWPESLCVGGIKKNSPVYKIFEHISRKIYRAADKILVTSRMFSRYLVDKFDISDDVITYLPQYAEGMFLELNEKNTDNSFQLLFAGNIGAAQSVDTIIEAARILKNENVVFNIVGDGSEFERLKESAADLPKVVFYGRKPLEDMPTYYEMADAMLVTLTKDPIISLTLPGKVQTYMAAGKPIIGAIDGETLRLLEEVQGGYCSEAENAVALSDNILKLKVSGEAKNIGRQNREYYTDNFSKDMFIDKLLGFLEEDVTDEKRKIPVSGL